MLPFHAEVCLGMCIHTCFLSLDGEIWIVLFIINRLSRLVSVLRFFLKYLWSLKSVLAEEDFETVDLDSGELRPTALLAFSPA